MIIYEHTFFSSCVNKLYSLVLINQFFLKFHKKFNKFKKKILNFFTCDEFFSHVKKKIENFKFGKKNSEKSFSKILNFHK